MIDPIGVTVRDLDASRLSTAPPAPRGVEVVISVSAETAGARDNGPPGVRPHYHPNYYGPFGLARTAAMSRPPAPV